MEGDTDESKQMGSHGIRRENNFGFTSTFVDKLNEKKNKSPIMITSSVQATLSGRFDDSEYGRSKLVGEEFSDDKIKALLRGENPDEEDE